MAKDKKVKQDNFIKFLGTAGARFVMIKQLRASGGIWIKVKNTNVMIDPGPGSIVRCASSKPKLDPSQLDAIILTHRHLDHSNDVNVMIEAMTEGGFKKKGCLFLPKDALGEDSVVLKHTLNFVGSVEFLKEKTDYSVGEFSFTTGPRNLHPVETYGLKFAINKKTISLIGDTAFYPGILDFYKSDILIINTVFYEPRPAVQHLSFEETRNIIEKLRPKTTILTHFGMTMLKAKPHILVENLKQELNLDIIAAYDGMSLTL
ncbi:MAG: MBL fold metallo-hydrolase [Candidatus Omnitrophica bacterium]|nr:MBL fold metallo-hydrolase [Candidatus Omnitrophota bacterium]MDD5352124.1 MBL fold metallo-hydrolase [Candidatus Omnitrophota bacterium]MDD5549722.1 MBL fold metallo-hydrolase [Candidatus Omnitrophota bacterium]